MIESIHIPRLNFERRLEPRGDLVLHGAGQSPEAFRQYFDTIGESKPVLFMTYVTLKEEISQYFQWLKQRLDEYLPYQLVPQIGLHLAGDALDEQPVAHYEQEVAEGRLDEQIQNFCSGLHSLKRPAFVRIGFEFNGPWNAYQPDAYKAAWIRIVSTFRTSGLNEVAAVWCYCPLPGSREHEQGIDRDYLAYYPGDEYVDWWSIDLFSPEDFRMDNTLAFMQDALRRRYPVMIGESTPRWVGGVQEGVTTWNKWFEPYFTFIRTQPTVKAFCYISWNWAEYPIWSDWGDARIWANEVILDLYKQEVTDPLYRHASLNANS